MSAVGERSPLATLAPANKRPAEVRERVRDGLYGAREDCGVCARATAKKLGRMGSSLAPQSTFPRASVESHASLTTAQPPHPPVSSLRANPTRSPPEQLYSLLALSRPEGAPAEVLALALALVALDKRTGGIDRPLELWTSRVLEDSVGYADHGPWPTPKSWRGDAQWINEQLDTALKTTRDIDMQAIGAAFYACAIELGGGATFFPSKSNLADYFRALRTGTLRGVGVSARADRAPKRSLYLAPRVARLVFVHGAKLRAAVAQR